MKHTQLLKAIKTELKSKLVKENLEILDSQPDSEYKLEDKIGSFWIVKKAIKESTEDDMIQEVDVFGLAEMILQGLVKEDIVGLYKAEGKARSTSRKMLRTRDGELKEDIKTGSQQLKDIDTKISDIKSDIQAKTQQGIDNPGQRSSVSSSLESLYAKLDKLEDLKKRLDASISSSKPSKEAPKEDE